MTEPMTATPARAGLDELDALLAAATPGEWTPATAPSADSGETHAEYLAGALRPDEGRPLWVAWAPAVEGLHDSDYVVPVVTGDGPASEANARFAAAAHTAMPRLLAAIRAAYALAEELESAAELYDAAALDGRMSGDLMAEGGHLIQAGDARRFTARLRAVLDEALGR